MLVGLVATLIAATATAFIIPVVLAGSVASVKTTAAATMTTTMTAPLCDHIDRIAPAEFLARQQRIATELANAETLAFVTEPGATMLYLTEVSWKLSERAFLFVVTDTADTFWICPAFEEGRARELVGEDTVVYVWQEDESPFELLFDALGRPNGSRVAVEHEARFFIPDGIRESFGDGNSIVSGLDILREVRAIKSSAEIDIMRCANEATKRSIAVVADLVYEGISESELGELVNEALDEAGLSNCWNLVLFGENAAYPHGTGNRVTLKTGDLILIDCGGELLGYQSDITRTFPFGPYNETQLHMWNTVREAQIAALNAIRPGVPVGNIDAAARAVAEENGYGSDYEAFTHRLGHGIGIQGHEEVYMVRGNEWPMTPGLCFSVEPGLYIVGVAGVRIEDIVCCTDSPPYYELFGAESHSIDDPLRDH